MKHYPLYKPSQIQWIEDIPEHWDVRRLAMLGNFSKGGGITRNNLSEVGRPVILYGDIYTKYDIGIKNVIHKIPESVATKSKKIGFGTLLFTGSGETVEEIGKCVMLQTTEAFVGGDVIVFEQQENDSLFMCYVLNTSGAQYEKSKQAKGQIVVHIYSSQLRNIYIPLPPPAEQTAIANFLDSKTAQIDQIITDKQKLIELYEEEKKALINEAVTKGINPKAKIRDSGIEWLGEVPEHWEVKKLKYVTNKIGSGVTPKGGSEVYQSEGIPLLRSQNIYNDGLRLDDVAYIDEDIHESMKGSQVKTGDVLLNITGASLGRCYFFTGELGEANVNQHVCIIRLTDRANYRFIHYLMISEPMRLQIDNSQTGSGREGLNFERLANFYLGLPDLSEQQQIVDYLDSETNNISEQIDRIIKEIDLLKEYRQALIFEAVTGKIDVRNN